MCVNHSFQFQGYVERPGVGCCPLTALLRLLVVVQQRSLATRAEKPCPVQRVVETQLAVVADVDVPSADLLQRLEAEGRDPALLQDQQRDAADGENQHWH